MTPLAIIGAAVALLAAIGLTFVRGLGRSVDQQSDAERYRRAFGEYGDEGEGA
ncbi:MAG: hypothetical protein ACK4ZW_08390 [Blastomonas sp.]